MKIQFGIRRMAALLLATIVTIQGSAARGPVLGPPKISGKSSARLGRPVVNDQYKIVPVPLPGTAVFSLATDINERGTVVGVYDVVLATGTIREYTFLWGGKEVTTIENPGGDITSVAGIDASGRLFGNWGSSIEQTAGFYDVKRNMFLPLPAIPGKSLNIGARAIDSGVALGYACEGTFDLPVNCVSWLWDGKNYQFLQLGNPLATPSYINNRGQIVGYVIDPPVFTGFLYDRGGTTWLFPPGINSTEFMPRSITNSGVILMNGETDPTTFWQPFLYDHGTVKLLPEYGGAGQTTYLGLNERGDLAGLFFSDTGAFAIVAYRN